jgi:hypothetical protein
MISDLEASRGRLMHLVHISSLKIVLLAAPVFQKIQTLLNFKHLPDGFKDDLELSVVFLFEIVQFTCKLFMGCNHFPQFNKGAHDVNTWINRSLTIQNIGSHNNPMFRKGVGQVGIKRTLMCIQSSGKRLILRDRLSLHEVRTLRITRQTMPYTVQYAF